MPCKLFRIDLISDGFCAGSISFTLLKKKKTSDCVEKRTFALKKIFEY